MENQHWREDDFIADLYGVGPEDGHLDSCAACRSHRTALQSKRKSLRPSFIPVVPESFWAGQRGEIKERLLGAGRVFHFRLAPALSALLLLAVLVTVFRPVPGTRNVETSSDEKVFEEAFRLASGTAPVAVEPIEYLFEVQQ